MKHTVKKIAVVLLAFIFLMGIIPGELIPGGLISTVVAATTVLDNCDATTGWTSANTLSIDTSDKKEGTASLKGVGSGTDQFKKVFSTPLNTTVTESGGYLQFWYYVSDLSKFNSEGQIEIGSSGAPDTNEYSWDMATKVKPNLVNGWNLVTLKISDAAKIGTPNLNAINWFRVYQFVSASITTKIDYIRFYDGRMDNCDATTGWTSANTLSLDTADKKEGTASLKGVGSGTDHFKKVFSTPVASGVTEANGAIQFWYYVSDVTKLNTNEGQIEIGSSGAPDVNEYNWFIPTQVKPNLVNGWNLVTLNLSAATKIGSPNLNSINWFRVYNFLSASITTKIDDIRFITVGGPTPTPTPTPATTPTPTPTPGGLDTSVVGKLIDGTS